MALVSAYVAMMPRLQAQEQLARVRAGGLAFGGYAQADAAAMLGELKRQAAGGADAATGRARKVGPAEMAAAGIGVTVVPRKDAADV